MIFLNDRDIRDCISIQDMIEAVEKSYRLYEDGSYYMPDRISIDKDGDMLMFMPGYTERAMGTKILTLYPDNNKKSLPVIDGLMLVNDVKTGEVLSIMDGKTITELRTGAVGAVGIKYTTAEDVSTIGLIGTGVQGLVQLEYACEVRDIKTINIYNRNDDKTNAFVEKLRKRIDEGIIINLYNSEREVVINSQVIVTATTSKEPVIPDDESILRGKHFIGIGSYKEDMREYPDALSRVVDKVYIDTEFAKEETGDLKTPISEAILDETKIILFSDFLLNRTKLPATTWYKSVGMGLFDVVVSRAVYEKAVEKKIGQKIDF